jgi:hypothetical protein
MNDSNQVVEDLKAARNALVTRGRARNGHLVNPDRTVCALGAIAVAVNDETWEALYISKAEDADGNKVYCRGTVLSQRFCAVERALANHLPGEDRWIWKFNDRRATTDADVLNLFDKAICDLGGAL